VVLKWFYSLSRRKTFVGVTCALPSALLVDVIKYIENNTDDYIVGVINVVTFFKFKNAFINILPRDALYARAVGLYTGANLSVRPSIRHGRELC